MAGIIVIFSLTTSLRRGEQVIWGAKFLKLFLEDMFLSSIVTITANFVMIRGFLRLKKLPKVLTIIVRFLVDFTLLETLSLLYNYKYRPPASQDKERDVSFLGMNFLFMTHSLK